MLSTELQQESMKTRIERIVTILMEERPALASLLWRINTKVPV